MNELVARTRPHADKKTEQTDCALQKSPVQDCSECLEGTRNPTTSGDNTGSLASGQKKPLPPPQSSKPTLRGLDTNAQTKALPSSSSLSLCTSSSSDLYLSLPLLSSSTHSSQYEEDNDEAESSCRLLSDEPDCGGDFPKSNTNSYPQNADKEYQSDKLPPSPGEVGSQD
ncbi:uncharacterized protein LOC111087574 isoform X2 [Limulus polyphemus]|uniref:Uncharacterized protein LOC111087574 isoform X1 n=1 Tax=Limulus polyphemus TaxID=6850 RepID=A0ABM1T3C4_LIMPO|nr:uncharacterized protein LOC111087574 isoform X1 [Limulus polyphemus]XP_022250380.1 uncharacterized protein LOC111087574 isoform X2 [Limulus polyphemus]